MADLTAAILQAALEQRVREKLVTNPNRATVGLNLAYKTRGSGQNIAWQAEFGTDVGAGVADGAVVSTYNSDEPEQAQVPWAIYSEPFKMTGLAEAIAAGEPTMLRNTYLNQLIKAGQRLASGMNIAYWQGTGASNQAIGHCSTAGPFQDSGTYATIDRSSFPQWAGNVDENAGTPRSVTLAIIDGVIDAAYEASGKEVEYMVATPTLWRAIAALVAPDRRFIKETMIRGQEIVLSGGLTALEHNGIPIFKDKDLPAGYLMGMGAETGLEMLPAPQLNDGDTDIVANIPIAGTPQEQAGVAEGAQPVMAKLIRHGKDGDARGFQLVTYWNTVNPRPNCTFMAYDLQP